MKKTGTDRAVGMAAAFNQYNGSPNPGLLTDVFATFERRKLGDKHFLRAHEALEAMMDAAPLPIFRHALDTGIGEHPVPLAKRVLDVFMVHVVLKADDHSIYVPATTRTFLTEKQGLHMMRALPLDFKSDHIEERHRQRLDHPLDYQSMPFARVIAFALTLCRVLGREGTGMPEKVPVAVPYDGGLLMGQAKHIPLGSYGFEESCYSAHGAKRDVIGIEPEPLYHVELRTLINQQKFFSNQAALHRQLMRFYEDPELNDGIAASLDDFARGGSQLMVSLGDSIKIHKAFTAMATTIHSPEWQAEAARSQQNFEKHAARRALKL